MKNKTYPTDVTEEISKISNQLSTLFKSGANNLRTVAKFSGLSVNSVRSVLDGKTANIATYSLIAKALGTNLIDLVANLKNSTPSTTAPSTP